MKRPVLEKDLPQVQALLRRALGKEMDTVTRLGGMTNRTYHVKGPDHSAIVRIPGEGTDQLINRRQEARVYEAIRDKGICDDIVAINPENGYKITAFLEGAHNCDPLDDDQVALCMQRLRQFHEMGLQVEHSFDIFGQIEYYHGLWQGKPSLYRDHSKTTQNVYKLKALIDAQPKQWTLTHMDAVPDNFLFCRDGSIRLIDWEYAGMQDPHVDLAMFCIYALYDRPQVDRLIDLYFPEGCPQAVRLKIYCYIAACGLLWSNWCEYKAQLGVEFGEYALRQYRYAKDYYRIVRQAWPEGEKIV